MQPLDKINVADEIFEWIAADAFQPGSEVQIADDDLCLGCHDALHQTSNAVLSVIQQAAP